MNGDVFRNPFVPSRRLARSPPPAAAEVATTPQSPSLQQSQLSEFISIDAGSNRPAQAAPKVTVTRPEAEAATDDFESEANDSGPETKSEAQPQVRRAIEIAAEPELSEPDVIHAVKTDVARQLKTVPEPDDVGQVEAVPEPEVEAVPEPEVEAVPEPEVEAVPEPEVEAVPEPEVEAVPEPDVEAVPEPEVEAVPEPEVVGQVEAVLEPEVASEPNIVPEPESTSEKTLAVPELPAVPEPEVSSVPKVVIKSEAEGAISNQYPIKAGASKPTAVAQADDRADCDPELSQRLLEAEAQAGHLVEENARLRFDLDCCQLVFSEFDRCLRALAGHKRDGDRQVASIAQDRERAHNDLRTSEAAFAELHRRFEKSKQIAESLRANETVLTRCAQECQVRLQRNEQRYQALKAQAEAKLEAASCFQADQRRAADADLARLQAVLRKAELRTQQLQAELDQRTRENAELTSICDELIRKVGQGGST